MLTATLWGITSDKFGRKPIMLIGLLGSTLSIILFGFSTSLTWAILSRALCGLFNGSSPSAYFSVQFCLTEIFYILIRKRRKCRRSPNSCRRTSSQRRSQPRKGFLAVWVLHCNRLYSWASSRRISSQPIL